MSQRQLSYNHFPTNARVFSVYKSSFGAKTSGPLADQEAFAPETTTGMSVKPCETRRERKFLLAMRKLRSSAAARWTYTHPLTTKGKSGSALSFSNDLNTSILETVRIIYQRYSCGLILLQLGIQTVRIGFFQKLLCGVCRHGKLNLISCLRFFLL